MMINAKYAEEIKFYKKFGVKNIDWIGIHKNSKFLTKKKKEKYLKKFHIIDDNNENENWSRCFS